MISVTEEAILRSYAKDYVQAHNNVNVYHASRCKANLVEYALKICGWHMEHSGEYVKNDEK